MRQPLKLNINRPGVNKEIVVELLYLLCGMFIMSGRVPYLLCLSRAQNLVQQATCLMRSETFKSQIICKSMTYFDAWFLDKLIGNIRQQIGKNEEDDEECNATITLINP